jgi:hypothetical protein
MRVSRRERGEGQFGCIVALIVLVVAAFIAYKIIPVKVKAAEVRQEMQDDAKSAGMMNDERIRASILAKAREDNLPITDDNLKISRGANQITITVDYVVPIEFPGYTYMYHIHNEQSNPIF